MPMCPKLIRLPSNRVANHIYRGEWGQRVYGALAEGRSPLETANVRWTDRPGVRPSGTFPSMKLWDHGDFKVSFILAFTLLFEVIVVNNKSYSRPQL